MSIQVYGKAKCFDTKNAQRFFKERGIAFQAIDLARYEMGKREFEAIKNALGGVDSLLDEKAKGAEMVKYLAYEQDKEEKLLHNLMLLRTPIVRNGRQVTVGYCPEVWKGWLD